MWIFNPAIQVIMNSEGKRNQMMLLSYLNHVTLGSLEWFVWCSMAVRQKQTSQCVLDMLGASIALSTGVKFSFDNMLGRETAEKNGGMNNEIGFIQCNCNVGS